LHPDPNGIIRFYGKTKKGKYVTEQEAIREGDKAAKRE
jgi:hypothetical protein